MDSRDNFRDIIEGVVPIIPVPWKTNELFNKLYVYYTSRKFRKRLDKAKRFKRLKKVVTILKSDDFDELLNLLFEDYQFVEDIDRVFLNFHHRYLCRIRLEMTYNGETEFVNKDVDPFILQYIKTIKVLCNLFGMKNTVDEKVLEMNVLTDNYNLWRQINEQFEIGEFEETPSYVLYLLNVIFDQWSGTICYFEEDKLKIVAATFVKRCLDAFLLNQAKLN